MYVYTHMCIHMYIMLNVYNQFILFQHYDYVQASSRARPANAEPRARFGSFVRRMLVSVVVQ